MKFTISILSVLSLLSFAAAQNFYEDDGLYAREAEAEAEADLGEFEDLYSRAPEEFDDTLYARDLDSREAEAFDDIYARAPEDVDNTIFDYEY